MAAKKGRQVSKAAQATQAKRAERANRSWEDEVAGMDHPETATFRERSGDAEAPAVFHAAANAPRRPSWLGAVITLAIAIAAAIALALNAR
jgi:hypothetical protein